MCKWITHTADAAQIQKIKKKYSSVNYELNFTNKYNEDKIEIGTFKLHYFFFSLDKRSFDKNIFEGYNGSKFVKGAKGLK